MAAPRTPMLRSISSQLIPSRRFAYSSKALELHSRSYCQRAAQSRPTVLANTSVPKRGLSTSSALRSNGPKVYFNEGKRVFWGFPLAVGMGIGMVILASGIYWWSVTQNKTMLLDDMALYPPEVNKLLRAAIYASKIERRPDSSLGLFKQAYAKALELGMRPSDEGPICIKFSIVAMLEEYQLYDQAIAVMQGCLDDCRDQFDKMNLSDIRETDYITEQEVRRFTKRIIQIHFQLGMLSHRDPSKKQMEYDHVLQAAQIALEERGRQILAAKAQEPDRPTDFVPGVAIAASTSAGWGNWLSQTEYAALMCAAGDLLNIAGMAEANADHLRLALNFYITAAFIQEQPFEQFIASNARCGTAAVGIVLTSIARGNLNTKEKDIDIDFARSTGKKVIELTNQYEKARGGVHLWSDDLQFGYKACAETLINLTQMEHELGNKNDAIRCRDKALSYAEKVKDKSFLKMMEDVRRSKTWIAAFGESSV